MDTGLKKNLRCMTGGLALMALAFIAEAGTAGAASLPDVPGEISIASTSKAFLQPVRLYPGLFGLRETASADISPFWKWVDMYTRFQTEIHRPAYLDVLIKWQNALLPLRSLSIPVMAERVNVMINALPYVHDDLHIWGTRDYWETPLEFISHGGDCKDYAIAKYASLRMLGVPEENLRITIVHDLQSDEYHAVLVLITGNTKLVLDNLRNEVLPSSQIKNYRPLFSINRTTRWLYRFPGSEN